MLHLALAAMILVADQPTTFKNYALGTTLEEFRALPMPPSDWPGANGPLPVRVACSGEEHTVIQSLGPGWKVCNHEQKYTVPGILNTTIWVRDHIALTNDVSALVDFSFYQDRLAAMTVTTDVENLDLIEESLNTKFGKPLSVEKRDFQVQAGAVFPQRAVIWKSGQDMIELLAPSQTTKRMTVTYTDHNLAAKAESERKPANAM